MHGGSGSSVIDLDGQGVSTLHLGEDCQRVEGVRLYVGIPLLPNHLVDNDAGQRGVSEISSTCGHITIESGTSTPIHGVNQREKCGWLSGTACLPALGTVGRLGSEGGHVAW